MTGQIERVKVFICVAELSSFAETARSMKLARSAVTRHVSELEDTLGVQLLVRTTRKVSLTAAGQLYLDRVRPLVVELQQADELIKHQHGTLSGDLRISVPVSFGLQFLPSALNTFRAANPDLNLKIDLTDRFIDIVKEGYDMALRISGPPSDVSTIWRKIAPIPRKIVASPDYVARKDRIDHPRDMHGHDVLHYSHYAGGATWQLSRRDGEETIVQTFRREFEANSGDLIVAMAVDGAGITMMPAFMVAEHLESGRLVEILPEWNAPEIWVTAYYPPYERLPAKVAAFTKFVERAVSSLPD